MIITIVVSPFMANLVEGIDCVGVFWCRVKFTSSVIYSAGAIRGCYGLNLGISSEDDAKVVRSFFNISRIKKFENLVKSVPRKIWWHNSNLSPLLQ